MRSKSCQTSRLSGWSKDQSGVALLVTMWILVFLIIIVSEFSYVMRIELKLNKNLKDETQAYYLALAGVESAINELMGEYQFEYLDSNGNMIFAPGKDSDYGSAVPGEQIVISAPQRSNIRLEQGLFSYRVTDQERKFNINSLRNRNPQPDSPYNKFRSILLFSGVQTGVELDTISDSVIDWLDQDENHGLNGAESDWYEKNYAEMGFMEPYKSKNGKFDTVEELLMVRGMTSEILYGTTRATEMGLSAIQTNNKEKITDYKGIYDYLCASPHASSRINLNTISNDLVSILYPENAAEILTERQSNGGIYSKTRGSSKLSNVSNRSYTFLIESTGRVYGSEITRTIKAIVWKRGSRTNSRLTYQYWNDNAPVSEVETEMHKTATGDKM